MLQPNYWRGPIDAWAKYWGPGSPARQDRRPCGEGTFITTDRRQTDRQIDEHVVLHGARYARSTARQNKYVHGQVAAAT